MGGLQISGAADDLAGIAGRAFEQHVDGFANHGLVEGRLLAVDQFLEAAPIARPSLPLTPSPACPPPALPGRGEYLNE